MTRSPFRRLVFGTLRRLLYLWVRSETINQSSLTLNLDRSRPVFYVLQSPSLTELAVVDAECTKAGLPRPVLPVSVGPLMEPAAFFYLTPDPDKLAGGLNSYRYKPDPRQDCSRADSPWEPGRAKASTASISDPALPVAGTGPGQNP